ncbi:MAG: hypothetical protein QM723_34145 [Myxococcaceae bacterium]
MIKMIVWSVICIGVGVVIGRYPFEGKTVFDRAEHEWQDKKVSEKFTEKFEAGVHDAKKAIGKDGPSETHSKDDRASIDKLLAKRAEK